MTPSIYEHPDDNRDRDPAAPIRRGNVLRCPGCGNIVSVHVPPACPDCLQRLADLEPEGHVHGQHATEAGIR